MKETYTYAVSRVRCRETDLLTRLDFDRLMQCKTEEECLRTLQDKGWGKEAGVSLSAEDLLLEENTRLWQFAGELVPDLTVFNVLRLPADFNNLKAAIKSVLTKTSPPHIYMAGGTVDPALMQKAVEKNDFSLLPPFLSEPGRQAAQVLLQNRDGQRCDVILDRACLFAIQQAGKESDCPLLSDYAEMVTALANIRVAVRCQKTGKNRTFLLEALTPCRTLSLESLCTAALKGRDDFLSYLSFTPYAEAAEALRESMTRFEKWCDDRLIAYILARQNEMSNVRVLLAGKRHHMDDRLIQERLRELYV